MLCYKIQTKFFSCLLFAVFSVFVSNIFAQQGKLVEALDIQGNRRLTDVELLQHIKTRPGEPFNEKQTQNDLQSLLKLGVFNTSQTRVFTEVGVRGGVNVIFEVMELPLIVELKFDGLRYLSDKEILAELREQKLTIEVGTPYDLIKLRDARRIITEYLGKRGFMDAKVTITEEEVTATTVKVSFVIDEMPNDDEENCCQR